MKRQFKRTGTNVAYQYDADACTWRSGRMVDGEFFASNTMQMSAEEFEAQLLEAIDAGSIEEIFAPEEPCA